jgi:hypothetical protein
MILIPSALDPHSGENRETREGWTLLTEDTEVNGDSQSTNERGPSLVGSLGLSCWYKRFFSALAAQGGPVQNIIFLTAHYIFHFLCRHRPVSRAGSRAGSPVS